MLENQPYTKINIEDIRHGFSKEYYKTYFSNKDKGSLLTDFTGAFLLNQDQKTHLINYIKNKGVSLTPTSLTTYFKVPFIYYIEKVLGLDTFKKSINLYLGDFFHILIEVLMVLKYEEKTIRNSDFSNDKELNEAIINYIIKKDMDGFTYEDYFEDFFEVYFKKEIQFIVNLKNKNINELDETEKLLIKMQFYIHKNKSYITRALERLIDLEDNISSKELYLEKEVIINEFNGRADLVKVYPDNSFSIIDYKTSSKDAFHYDKIIEIFKALLSENKEEEISLSALNLLQLIFYAYFIKKENSNLKLKDLAFYSYFEENLKLNALSTSELDKVYYTTGKDRMISLEQLDKLYELIEKLLEQTKNDIFNADFPITVRKDTNQKEDLEETIYSIYEALAYFNTNEERDDENED
ncbi:hypothetical protein BN85403440 [Alteracholeplasma palmae J233]|uniref:PD-(D/E)XK endonuclease-like domain-containing protein n=1 Tax=Alteracholeplasma palmae (strain ATCC 49389 / J233) TaxID=1318466 RepID=U4KR78_ALTPJ|nr:PD-(D/E)XK nuclease family protein [Alteracholeplasma palmae]CCV63921.1 hypothetical protein BN85403440 [Alteracholeplasma palmae J233]